MYLDSCETAHGGTRPGPGQYAKRHERPQVPAKNVRGWQADEDRLVPKLVVAAPVPDLSVRARRIGVAIAVWRCQDGLTSAETEVLLLATEGLTVLQIAEARGTTVETALTQSKALLRKTLDDSLPFAALRLLGEAASLP